MGIGFHGPGHSWAQAPSVLVKRGRGDGILLTKHGYGGASRFLVWFTGILYFGVCAWVIFMFGIALFLPTAGKKGVKLPSGYCITIIRRRW